MSQGQSNELPLPDKINILFLSMSSQVDIDMSRIRPEILEVTSAMRFDTFLYEGIQILRKEGILVSQIAVEKARIFVTASPRQHRKLVQDAGAPTPDYGAAVNDLTLILEGYKKDTLPILVCNKDNVPFQLVLDIYKPYYRALRITKTKTSDFCKEDRQLNKLFEAEQVPGLNLGLWKVIKKVKGEKIKLNKAQFNRATNNAHYLLNCPFFWDQIKSTRCFEIVGNEMDNDEEIEDDSCDEILLWTLALDTGRVFCRADEFTFKKKTSTGIKGSMVQSAICDIYEGDDYEVTENQGVRLSYLIRYQRNLAEFSRLTPHPDTFVVFLHLLIVICEIISNPSQTDREHGLMEGISEAKALRSKNLVDPITGETLMIVIYMDALMVVDVYFLFTTKEDAEKYDIADLPVYMTEMKFYIAGGRPDVQELGEDGNPTGRTITGTTKIIQFIVLLWQLCAVFERMCGDQQELIREVVGELRSMLILLQKIPDLVSSSKVSTGEVQPKEFPGLVSLPVPNAAGGNGSRHSLVPRGSRRASQDPRINDNPGNVPIRRSERTSKPSRGSRSRSLGVPEDLGEEEEDSGPDGDNPKDHDYNPRDAELAPRNPRQGMSRKRQRVD
ncbi:hypothetical protein AAF712_003879 [Marasmius tenuissimus]|uniref:Uncharacterized protein n=1 Tax=Marasmius tenuissimus TaxID=585030 RepID=A0ABR3A5N8_9AGAR